MALKEAKGGQVKVGRVAQAKVGRSSPVKEKVVKEGRAAQAKVGRASQVKEEKVAQVKKGGIESSGNGEALLEVLKGEDVTGLSVQVKAFVSPLDGLSGGVKENMSRTELHKLAKQFVPFLVRLLKLCFVNVASVPAGEQGKAERRGDEVFSTVEIALDRLDLLRSFITGSPF